MSWLDVIEADENAQKDKVRAKRNKQIFPNQNDKDETVIVSDDSQL